MTPDVTDCVTPGRNRWGNKKNLLKLINNFNRLQAIFGGAEGDRLICSLKYLILLSILSFIFLKNHQKTPPSVTPSVTPNDFIQFMEIVLQPQNFKYKSQ